MSKIIRDISDYLKVINAWACEYSTGSYILISLSSLLIIIFILHFVVVFDSIKSNLVLAIYHYGYIEVPVSTNIVYDITGKFTNLYSWVLPLSITFYFFIAREQKALSESSLNLDRKGLRHYFVTLIGLIFIGVILGYLHDNLKIDHIPSVLFYLVGCLIFVMGLSSFIFYFIRSININYLFIRILNRTSFSISTLLLKKNTCYIFQEKLYSNLRYLIESVYQLLNLSINKGLFNGYRSNYREWKGIINLIFTIDRKDIELISKNVREYPGMYKIILSNQATLIISLYSSNKPAEGHDALLDLFALVPDGDITGGKKGVIRREYDALMQEYLQVLCNLGLFLYKSKIILYPLILQISGLPMQRIGIDKIISVYRTWIIKATESCDVKMLVCLSYALMETIEKASLPLMEETLPIATMKSMDAVPIEQMGFFMSKALNVHLSDCEEVANTAELSDADKSIGRCIYILLNAAIKSLEMSQYQCVGFVVKFIVSNFKSEITNKVFAQFVANNGRDNKFDDCEIGGSFGLNSFNLNNKTDRYCLEKLSFLMYGQQVYIKTNNVSIKYIPDEYINFKNCIGDNIKYIYDKIIAGKAKYGLIWLNNDKFHKRLFYEILEKR